MNSMIQAVHSPRRRRDAEQTQRRQFDWRKKSPSSARA